MDPFQLKVVPDPGGTEAFYVQDAEGRRTPLEGAGLNIVGASQALLGLSMRWLVLSGKEVVPGEPVPTVGEVRLVVRRKEARLLGSLLRRHLRRLPQPPGWMRELSRSFREMDEVLRWEEDR